MDRPNRVPRATPGVAASPVDTAVFAGQEGAPAMPTPLAKPQTQPDLFDAQQKMEMVRALGGLSESLRGATFAAVRNEQIIGGQYEEYGEQMGAIAAYMNSEGRSFTEALSQDQIEALDHPRAQLGMARGSAGVAARGLYKDLEANLAGMRVGDHAKDIGHYAAAFDNALNRMAYDYSGPRPDLFRQELLTASLPLRDRWVSENRAWINTEIIKDSESNLINATNDIMEATFGSRRDVIVESSLHDPNSLDPAEAMLGKMGLAKTQRIIGVSDKEHFDRRVDAAAAAITKMIDSEQGGLISSSNLNEIVAMQLIDLAKKSSELSGFAEAVLLKTETGPEDSRASILTGRSKDEYLKSKDAIKRAQVTGSVESANKAFKANVSAFQDTLIRQITGSIESQNGMSAEWHAGEILFSLVGDGTRKTYEELGFTAVREGSNVKLIPNEGTGATTSVTLDLGKMVDTSQRLLLDRLTNEEMKANGGNYMVSAALASNRAGIPHPVLKATFSSIYSSANELRLAGGGQEPTEEELARFGEAITAFNIIRGSSQGIFEGTLGKEGKEEREFFQLASYLMDKSYLNLEGGSLKKTFMTLSRARLDLGNVEKLSDEIDTQIVAEDLKYGTNRANFEAHKEIKDLAFAFLRTGVKGNAKDAVAAAIESYNFDTVMLPNNVRVNKNDWDIDRIQEQYSIYEFTEGDWKNIQTIAPGVAGTLESAQQGLLAIPEIATAYIDAVFSSDITTLEALGPIMAKIGQRTMKNLSARFDNITWYEVLERTPKYLKENPSADFIDENSTPFRSDLNIDKYFWVPVNGSKGQLYTLAGVTDGGHNLTLMNPNNKAGVYTMQDIVDIFLENNKQFRDTGGGVFREDKDYGKRENLFIDFSSGKSLEDIGSGPMGTSGF